MVITIVTEELIKDKYISSIEDILNSDLSDLANGLCVLQYDMSGMTSKKNSMLLYFLSMSRKLESVLIIVLTIRHPEYKSIDKRLMYHSDLVVPLDRWRMSNAT